MKGKTFIIACVFSILSLLMAPGVAFGQGNPPPEIPILPETTDGMLPEGTVIPSGAVQQPNGLWMLAPAPGGLGTLSAGKSVTATATFNYIMQSVGYSWMDARDGAILALDGQSILPVGLPFTFSFYDNPYNTVYVSKDGFLTFNPNQTFLRQSPIPSSNPPNNIVAPYWAPLDLSDSGTDGRVYVKIGGVAPNRYVIFEWYLVHSFQEASEFTFEAVLNEDGSILFQYDNMSYVFPVWCPSAGIEDASGTGMKSLNFCSTQTSYQAVSFTLPPVIFSLPQVNFGAFAGPGDDTEFHIYIHNISSAGADTYELSNKNMTPRSNWPVQLYEADGITPLTNTNGYKGVDTGKVNQGETVEVVAKVHIPAKAVIGANNTTTLTIQSRLDLTKTRTITLQSAVPSAFAQVLYNDNDKNMGVLLSSGGQSVTSLNVPNGNAGYLPAVTRGPDGSMMYAWVKRRCLDTTTCSIYVAEIEGALLNNTGAVSRPVARLIDLSSATTSTEDRMPSVAIAPDGSIGLLWVRAQIDIYGRENQNVYFEIMNGQGTLVAGPVSLTNNTDFHMSGDTFATFSGARLAATGDNRFFIVWRQHNDMVNGTLDDIYYAISDNTGNWVKQPARMTADTPGKGRGYTAPTVTGLHNNRVLVAYSSQGQGIVYSIRNSDGSIFKNNALAAGGIGTNLSADELSNGKVLLAWTGTLKGRSRINYAVLSNGLYRRQGLIGALDFGYASTGGDYVSVTADGSGRAVLTWMDGISGQHRNLYYGLVGSDGRVKTPAMVYQSSEPGDMIFSSSGGQGSCPFTGQ